VTESLFERDGLHSHPLDEAAEVNHEAATVRSMRAF